MDTLIPEIREYLEMKLANNDLSGISNLLFNQNPLSFRLLQSLSMSHLYENYIGMLCLSNDDAIVQYIMQPEFHEHLNWKKLCGNSHTTVVNMLCIMYRAEYKPKRKTKAINKTKAIDLVMPVMQKNVKKIYWDTLCTNDHDYIVDILLSPENKHLLHYGALSHNMNPRIIRFMMLPENKTKVSWYSWLKNNNDEIVDYFLSNEEHMLQFYTNKDQMENPYETYLPSILEDKNRGANNHYWDCIMKNSNQRMVDFIFKKGNELYINFNLLSYNPNYNVVEFLLLDINKKQIFYPNFYINPNIKAILHIMERRFDNNLLGNTGIFIC